MDSLTTKEMRAKLIAKGIDVSKCFERSDLEKLWQRCSTEKDNSGDQWVNVEKSDVNKPVGSPPPTKVQAKQPQQQQQQQQQQQRTRQKQGSSDMTNIIMLSLLAYAIFGGAMLCGFDLSGGGNSSPPNDTLGDATEYDGNDDFLR
jgi:hypothetical protein